MDDLQRLDAAQLAMGRAGRAGERDADTVPGYEGLEDARRGALDRLEKIPADSLIGLQAKARAVLTPIVRGCCDDADIAASLDRDLLDATDSTIAPQPDPIRFDPIMAAIEEGRRLLQGYLHAHETIKQDPATIDPAPEWGAAGRPLWAYIDRVLQPMVPMTGAGCRELARFTSEYHRSNEVAIFDDEMTVLNMIARSPLA